MKEIINFKYRPEVDGLRAVAVLAVVMFHAGFGVSGGFVGVDVFFVISGYLITTLIARDLIQGKFSFLNFWHRRIKRIFPALGVVVLAVLVAGWFLLLPDDYSSLADSAFYQSIWGANIYFWREVGYFSGPAEEMPLLHTWSLAVEEQFYIIVPFVLALGFKIRRFSKRSILIMILLAGIILSLAVSIYAVNWFPSAAFYLLPSRGWELLLGSLLAFLPAISRHRRCLKELLSWCGISAIVGSCVYYTTATAFPGIAALLPCLGTALVIYGTLSVDDEKNDLSLVKLLSARVVVFVGLISYSLYLWHWPLLAFGHYLAFEPLEVAEKLALVILAFLLAYLSWRFVETPFRKGFLLNIRVKSFAFAGMSVLAMLVGCHIIIANDGCRFRFDAAVLMAADAKNDSEFHHELSVEKVEHGDLIPMGVAAPRAPIWGVVWGDSFAMAAAPAFDSYMTRHGLSGRLASCSITAPLVGYMRTDHLGLAENAPRYSDGVVNFLHKNKVKNVFLIACWSSYTGPEGTGSEDPREAMLLTIEAIAQAGTRPWIVLRPPRQRTDVPRLLAQSRLRGFNYNHLLAEPNDYNGLFGNDSEFLDQIEAAGAKIINPRPLFLSECGGFYIIEKDGVTLYRDKGHLTAAGARLMILPLLEELFTAGDNAEGKSP